MVLRTQLTHSTVVGSITTHHCIIPGFIQKYSVVINIRTLADTSTLTQWTGVSLLKVASVRETHEQTPYH